MDNNLIFKDDQSIIISPILIAERPKRGVGKVRNWGIWVVIRDSVYCIAWKVDGVFDELNITLNTKPIPIPRLIETLSILKGKYKEVYFIPGNHELWINKNDIAPNSLVKLFEIVRRCAAIGK